MLTSTPTSVLTTTALVGETANVINGMASNPKPKPASAWTNEAAKTAMTTAMICVVVIGGARALDQRATV